jgi:hypothetical protein
MRKCVYRKQLDLENAGCDARAELSVIKARDAPHVSRLWEPAGGRCL